MLQTDNHGGDVGDREGAAPPLDWSLIACPQCAAPLDGLTCSSCSTRFEDEGGTPRLFPPRPARTFESRYVPLEEVTENLRSSFAMPPRAAGPRAVGKGTYHLDAAHRFVLEGLEPELQVLEIGCGGGQMRTYVTGLGHRYLGTDISKTRVFEWLQAHGGADVLCDAHVLPVRSGTIDVVYSAAVVEHLAAPQLAVQEIARVLRPGGSYLGNGSFLEPWHDESFYHLTPNGAAALLLQAGLEPVHIWPSVGYSGYDAMFAMDNKATQLISPLGKLFRLYSHGGQAAKRRLQRSDEGSLAAIARTAGATDWIARKPDGA